MNKKRFKCNKCNCTKFDPITSPLNNGIYKIIKYKCRYCGQNYSIKDIDRRIIDD